MGKASKSPFVCSVLVGVINMWTKAKLILILETYAG